jgi:hypothetical protein
MTKKLLSRLALPALATVLGAAVLAPHSAKAQTAELPAWLSKTTIGGDLRVRLQRTFSGSADEQELIRARLAAAFNISDQLTANLRLASGNDTNTTTSSHQTLGDENFNKKPFWLDIASMDYKPVSGLVITGGKALNPFFSAAKNELVMDADVNPEGVNVKYSTEFGSLKPFAAVAYNIVSESGAAQSGTPGGANSVAANGGAADRTMLGGQIGASFKGDVFGATLAVGMYNYNGLKGMQAMLPGPAATGATRGNTYTGTPGTYAYDYKLTNVELELTTEAMGLPLTAYSSYVQNSDPGDKNIGLLGGLRVGAVKGEGSWAFDYNYRDLAADAIIANFTDGDFGGQTDVRGHRFALTYVPVNGFSATLGAIFAKTAASTVGTDWERYTLDLLATF